jgi:hypothetical protein
MKCKDQAVDDMRATNPATEKSERSRIVDAALVHFPSNLGLEVMFHHGRWYVVAFTSMARDDEEVFEVLDGDGPIRFQKLDPVRERAEAGSR